MNSTSIGVRIRRSLLAVLLAAPVLFTAACSTTAASVEPSEKSVTFKELHALTARLAQEPSTGAQAPAISSVVTLAGAMGTGSSLASNP